MAKKGTGKKIGIWALILLSIPIFVFTAAVSVVYINQDKIVQTALRELNTGFTGLLQVKGSHISPFHNFPYISVDFEDISFYETKDTLAEPLLHIQDAYVGFDLWTILSGRFNIKKIELNHGYINLVQHEDGSLNIAKAFSNPAGSDTSAANDSLHLDLRSLQLNSIHISKVNEGKDLFIDAFVHHARASFRTEPENLFCALDTKLELNVINEGDTLQFFRQKHIDLDMKADFDKKNEVLKLAPSELLLEGIAFAAEGSADFRNNADLDLHLSGKKSDFDLFFAFLPEELAQYMQRYKNAGELFFDARIKGPATNGHTPSINARFGCKNAWFVNTAVEKRMDELSFSGYYTNGSERTAASSEFAIMDLNARPGMGKVKGSAVLRNFDDPRVDMNVYTDFDLQFLAQFLQLERLKDLSGQVILSVNYDELVDIQLPAANLGGLETGVDSRLQVKNLNFRFPAFPFPIRNLNLDASVKNGNVALEKLSFLVGRSDLSLSGHLENLPGILHRSKDPVGADMRIWSKHINITELSSFDTTLVKPVKEELNDLELKLSFKTSAHQILEGRPLPLGEFFIDDFHASLKHYPHRLHDFHADLIVEENALLLKDFSGEIDKSDIHFSGRLDNYAIWFSEKPAGDARFDFNLNSHSLVFHDLLSYKGENYLPEDYRNEHIRELALHGNAAFHYNGRFEWFSLELDKAAARLSVHPLKIDRLHGRVHYQDHKLSLHDLEARLGRSHVKLNLLYHLNGDSLNSAKGQENHLSLYSAYLDIDELSGYTPPVSSKKQADHDSVFNIFELPFSNFSISADIGGINYHRIQLQQLKARIRIREDHFIYFDTLQTGVAGGSVQLSGYFNGSDPKKIYFSPRLSFRNVDIARLMLKFDSFGQDELLSNTIHGQVSGTLNGKIHMHTDLVPVIDDSEIHLDLQIVNGELLHFKPMEALSSFFKDKNLQLVRFDTLANHIDLKNGVLSIPSMNINSSLGFIEVSGTQSLNSDMEYYLRIPWKMVSDVGVNLLFGGRKREEVESDQVDDIVYRDTNKKVRFVNLKISGTADNFKVSLGKDRKTAGATASRKEKESAVQ